MNHPLVSICCATYNQANYIGECLEKIIAQQVNFTFEILIHDDASTDGTTQIIETYATKYPELIFPIYQTENQYQKGNKRITATFNLPRAKGKYIAICEGDDYWTDPFKLQKQVDFLKPIPTIISVAMIGKCSAMKKYFHLRYIIFTQIRSLSLSQPFRGCGLPNPLH